MALIEREALMEELLAVQSAIYMSTCVSQDECKGKRWAMGRAIDAVKDAHAVDAVPVVHGRWIVDECDSTDETPSRAWIEFHCSECDTDFSLEEGQYSWYMESDIPFKCCPICGARMDAKVGNK